MSQEDILKQMVYSSSLPKDWREPVYQGDFSYNFADNVPWYLLDSASAAAKGNSARAAVRAARVRKDQGGLDDLAWILQVPAPSVGDAVKHTAEKTVADVQRKARDAVKAATDWGPLLLIAAVVVLGGVVVVYLKLAGVA